jgi:hypothetical protein
LDCAVRPLRDVNHLSHVGIVGALDGQTSQGGQALNRFSQGDLRQGFRTNR